MQTIIEAKNLSICYEKSQPIIKNASFSINAKDFVFITGKSGSGKSTLIRSFYGAMPCAGGSLMVCLKELNNISSSSLAKLRQKLGLIFQDFKLIDEWSIEKNVMLPLLIKGYSKNISKKQAQKMLKVVNLLHKADAYPMQLSGGEQQRVAVARALAHNPQLFLCDEPTGALDYNTGKEVLKLLQNTARQKNITVIIITHNQAITPMADRIIKIKNGKVSENRINENPVSIDQIEW